jgi:hypothetical protein
LDERFPGLKKKYSEKYGNRYEVVSDNNHQLMRILKAECEKYRIVCDNDKLFCYFGEFKRKDDVSQISIFDYMQ